MIIRLNALQKFDMVDAGVFYDRFRFDFIDADLLWYRLDSVNVMSLTPENLEKKEVSNKFEANIATIETSGNKKGLSNEAVTILMSQTEPAVYIHEENFTPDQIEKIKESVSKSLDSVSKIVHVSKKRFYFTFILMIFVAVGICGMIYFFFQGASILFLAGSLTVSVIAFIALIFSKHRHPTAKNQQ